MEKETHLLIKGRGAQKNLNNRFVSKTYHDNTFEIDEKENLSEQKTVFQNIVAKELVHEVKSPDVGLEYSANPYQGCEHGCTYCYARYSHHYWGFNSGIDFEKNILVKENAAERFKAFISRPSWKGRPITLSGNTDCYQPIERKLKNTRTLLEIAQEFNQPITIITKNALVCRDGDILSEMANRNLCRVYLSINSLDETLVRKMEPRTSTAKGRLQTVKSLSEKGIPVGILNAPVIPGLNDTEIPEILRQAKLNGAKWARYTVVRLNGDIGDVFSDWLNIAYPEKKDKVINQIKACHEGNLNDSRFGSRMRGTGVYAKLIKDVFDLHCKKNHLNTEKFEFNCSDLKRPHGKQLSLSF